MLVWKDLKTELRGGLFVFSSISFGILLLVIIGMALDAAGNLPVEWSSGLLWMSLFFTTALSMTRHDFKEREYGGWLGVLLAPVDRSVVFYAKWLTTCLFVLVSELAMVTAFFVILDAKPPVLLARFVLVMLGGTVGLTGVGTFMATLAANSSLRDVLVPLLLFPLTIPLFLALIRLTVFTISPGLEHPFVWVEILMGYILVFSFLPWLLYETLMEV